MKSSEPQSARPEDGEDKKLNFAGKKFPSQTLTCNKQGPVIHGGFYFLKSMLDKMLNPISYKDRNGVYLGVNETFARYIVGLPEEEIIGCTLPEIYKKLVQKFPERSRVNGRRFTEICREWDQADTELLKSGGSSVHEQEIILADGTWRYFFVNRSTFPGENGDIFGLVTVLQDINELRKSEKSLEENEERYRIVTEQTGQLVYDYDVKTEVGNWGGAIEEIIGYLPQEFQGISFEVWIEHLHPEDRERMVKNAMKIQKEGGKYRFEFRLRKKDGTYFYVEDNGVCLLDEKGKPYRLLGIIKDITERKLIQERLEISEEKYRLFIHNFKGIAFQLDENLIPEFTHGAVEEITGYSEDDFMSTRVMWMNIVHPEDLPAVLKQVMMIKNSPRVYDTEFEYRIRCKDGKTKWVNELYQKVPGKNGKPDKYQGAVYDLSEKKEAEEALDEIKETRIKEIHHRIKNNLQIVSSLLDLQAEKFEEERVREAFRESQSRIISMALIHEELYKEKNMETLNFAAYLRKLVENLFQTYRLDHTGVSLQTDLKEDIFLNVDTAIPLGIIINELISNSLKHAFPGQEKGEIRIRLYKEEKSESKSFKGKDKYESGKLVLTVSDNGVGFSEDVNIDNPDTLGLQLVNALVDQLDGELELKRDNGTEFITRIDIAENS